ncbi:hypothetical protein GGQ85_000883 [Nitrobacter vulgaris]|nr:hypothetical protein [Nitrobacter vulgaris]
MKALVANKTNIPGSDAFLTPCMAATDRKQQLLPRMFSEPVWKIRDERFCG